MISQYAKRFAAVAVILASISMPNLAAAWYFTSWSRPTTSYSAYKPYTSAATSTATNTYTAGTSIDSTLLSLLNKERTSRGLRALQLDAGAASAARAKSQDMMNKGYFSHTSPTYGSPAQLLNRYGISYRMWAENIGKGSDAARLHAMWMASPGHRANILNPSFTHVGIGSVKSSTGYTSTQLFLGR